MGSKPKYHEGQAPLVRTDVDLSLMTTARTGCTVARLHIPHEGDDLTLLPSAGGHYLVISNGSNVLATDSRDLGDVIWMGEYDKTILRLSPGVYRVGCSVMAQTLIREVNADGYGDIEELISVPGMLGGLVCMNASIPNRACISDHLLSVEAFDGRRFVTLDRDECGFGYRESRFQDGTWIILAATFEFPAQEPSISKKRVDARRARVKELHDHSAPCFGTVFRKSSGFIMRLARRFRIGKGKSRFSHKTGNWLCCGGSFLDSLTAIRRVERLHRLAGKACDREVVVWE